MGTKQDFTFTTQEAPQVQGEGGATWEKVPLSQFPPSLSNNFGDVNNSVATAVSNMTELFAKSTNTLSAVTQELQNLSCQAGEFVSSLQEAQSLMTNFALANNETKVLVRQIGLDPAGTVNSNQKFMQEVENIMRDTSGELENMVASQIPINPKRIANSLSSNQTLLERNSINLGDDISNATFGVSLQPLSNDASFQNGFAEDSLTFVPSYLEKINDNSCRVVVDQDITDAVNANGNFEIIISGAFTSNNNGTFPVVKVNKNTDLSVLGVVQTKIEYTNPNGATESINTATATIVSASIIRISAENKIKGALERRGIVGANQRSSDMPLSTLIDILIEDGIVLEGDREIAIERLVRISVGNEGRIGGIVLVGKAPNLAQLSQKVGALSTQLTFLAPLAKSLASQAIAQSASGVQYTPDVVEPEQLDPSNNAGVRDVQSAQSQIANSGVLDYEQILLQPPKRRAPKPGDNEFEVWRAFTPSELLPQLSYFGINADEQIDQFTDPAAEAFENAVSQAASATNVIPSLAETVALGQSGLNSLSKKLDAQSKSVNSLVNKMNDLNTKITEGTNLLKDAMTYGPLSLDAHLIGPDLQLRSNSEFIDAVDRALSDATDPNRPTFGPPAAKDIAASQGSIEAALRGEAPAVQNTTMWFGIILTIQASSRTDLGNQMNTIANFLSIDDSPIDLDKTDILSNLFG